MEKGLFLTTFRALSPNFRCKSNHIFSSLCRLPLLDEPTKSRADGKNVETIGFGRI